MIHILRSTYHGKIVDCPINYFYGKDYIERDDVIIKTKNKGIPGKEYTYAEPAQKGWYAMGGNFLYTCNGVFPEFNKPIPLHDRQMNLETKIPL